MKRSTALIGPEMHWQKQQTLPWHNPLEFAQLYYAKDMALLYSSQTERHTGQFTYLFLNPLEVITGAQWQDLPEPTPTECNLPYWVGYLAYEMGSKTAPATPSPVQLPRFCLVRYGTLYQFDHENKVIHHYKTTTEADVSPRLKNSLGGCLDEASGIPPIAHLASNFTRAAHQAIIKNTVDQIHAGNFYQANITRKFFGEFEATPDYLTFFARLITASPAPYSAYIRHGETAILSSSPECFLSITADGTITTRPIKGSARRGDNEAEDAKIAENLKASAKNQAENLMITDLMRNDLAQVSEPMSVRVTEQSGLYTYRTIHHLISTITAQKSPNYSAYEVVRACFPPGSMTGAPKIAAMRWCQQQEGMERGVYSGAIGWFGAGNTCDLSVTIRTLILEGKRFEFQVGGGIVADSTPEEEWLETIVKARGILTALNLDEKALIDL